MRSIGNWLKGYLEYTRHLEAPDTFHFWAGVGAVAGALRGKVWIDMGFFKWKPNFFIIFVARPGIATKSTAMGVSMGLLRKVDGVRFGPDSVTWQALTKSFSEATSIVKLSDGTDLETSPITIAASELGTFLDPRNRELIDLLVDLWDGREVPWTRTTKGDGTAEIPNPWVNFLGATTPAWIAENFPEYAIGGGFTSRTVFVYADAKRHLVPYPKLLMGAEDELLSKALLSDLRKIALLKGEYILTKEATDWGHDWYERHWTDGPTGNDRTQGYQARKQTHVHKIAMVLAASQRDELIITPEDLEIAAEFLTVLEADMTKVFEHVTDSSGVKHASGILAVISVRHKITRASLWRELMTQMTHFEFDNALRGALESGYVKEVQSGTSLYLTASDLLLEKTQRSRQTAHVDASRLADSPPASESDGETVSNSSPDPLRSTST